MIEEYLDSNPRQFSKRNEKKHQMAVIGVKEWNQKEG